MLVAFVAHLTYIISMLHLKMLNVWAKACTSIVQVLWSISKYIHRVRGT